METNQIEKLLSYNEGSNLDFKSEVDLESKRGKADFLVEVLGLANSIEKPSFLVLGVENESKKAVGILDTITEERLQKIIADNCRPSMTCEFQYAAYKRKRIGILTIWGRQRPYTLKKDYGYEDQKGRQHVLSDKTVYVRRGSTGDTANPEEIAEMFFERQETQYESEKDFNVYDELDRISSNLFHINNSIDRLNERGKRERVIEYLFIGIVSGLIVGLLQAMGLDWKIYISGIFVSTFWISVLASALKIVRFGWIRSVLVSLGISITFVGLSVVFDLTGTQTLTSLGFPPTLILIWSGIKGTIGGGVAAFLGRGEYEYD